MFLDGNRLGRLAGPHYGAFSQSFYSKGFRTGEMRNCDPAAALGTFGQRLVFSPSTIALPPQFHSPWMVLGRVRLELSEFFPVFSESTLACKIQPLAREPPGGRLGNRCACLPSQEMYFADSLMEDRGPYGSQNVAECG